MNYAYSEFEKQGYTVTSGTTVVRDPAKVKFLYRHGLFSGADILSVGVASFGHLQGWHYQNQHDFQPYLDAVQAGQLPVHRALAPTADERLIREFILLLKLGRVDTAYFVKKFGIDPRQRFSSQLEALQLSGFLTQSNGIIEIHRAGLLQIDQLLHEFFLPEHRTGRYA